MSKSFGPSFNIHTFSATPTSPQNVSCASGSQNAQFSWSLTGTSSVAQSVTPATLASGNGTVQPSPSVILSLKKPMKTKKRTEEEIEITRKAAERFSARLALDQAAVLQPDVDAPFTDQIDVVRRILPYHIYHQPQEDLELLKGRKGKQKATDADLKAEVEETRFALECHKRYDKLRRRFQVVQTRKASRASPDDQAYVLAQAVLEADRADTTLLSNELKVARSDLERLEREKRAAAMTRTQYTTVPAPTMQTQSYRPYPYAYTQAYGTNIHPPTTSSFQINSLPSPINNTAIPVQLPVASLPALRALGIHPVPAASIAEGQATPPAILRGSTANGTMLMLEINVSLLQSAQMSGLAMVLNSLMSRASGSTAAPGTASPSTSANLSGSAVTQRPPTSPSSESNGPIIQ